MVSPTRTPNEDALDGRRLVVVGSMHRSGTTPARAPHAEVI